MIRFFWVVIIFLLTGQVRADEFIPIKVESEIICEAPLRFVISIKNISVEPFKIKNVYVEPTGKWLSGSLFLTGEGYTSFPNKNGSHFLTKAEEEEANRLIEIKPGDIRQIVVVLDKMYEVDMALLRNVSFRSSIDLAGDNYFVRSGFFNVKDYCSKSKRDKYTHQIIKNDNWDKVKEEFERQKREAERAPKYLRNF